MQKTNHRGTLFSVFGSANIAIYLSHSISDLEAEDLFLYNLFFVYFSALLYLFNKIRNFSKCALTQI